MFLYILSSAFLFIFFALVFYAIRYTVLDWKKLVFAVLATLLFKTPLFIEPFFGLEYEDSYIFNVVARQFANNVFTDSYFTESIVLGSLSDPILYGTYSGHYVFFSVFCSWIIRIVGYSPSLISYINAGITFLILLILIDFSNQLKLNSKSWWVIPSIFLISPIINVFGSTQLSETFSSFLLTTVIYFLIIYRKKHNYIIGISVVLSFMLSILTKRENNFLFLLIICYALYDTLILKRHRFHKAYFLYLVVLTVLILVNLFVEELSHSVKVESQEIGTAAFSIKYFSRIFPVFLGSLFTFQYFVLTGILLIASVIFMFIRKLPPIIYFCTIVLIGFLVLYSIHYRSYYFIHNESINEFDTFRYLNNIYPLIAIIAGYVLTVVITNSRIGKWSIIFVLIATVSISFLYTSSLRSNFSAEEYNIRFKDPIRIIDYFDNKGEDAVIISSDVLIFQIFGSKELFVCDVLDVSKALTKIQRDYEIYLHSNAF